MEKWEKANKFFADVNKQIAEFIKQKEGLRQLMSSLRADIEVDKPKVAQANPAAQQDKPSVATETPQARSMAVDSDQPAAENEGGDGAAKPTAQPSAAAMEEERTAARQKLLLEQLMKQAAEKVDSEDLGRHGPGGAPAG